MLLYGDRFLFPRARRSVITVVPAIAVIKSRCAAPFIYNCNDIGPVIVDIDVKAIVRIPLEACAGCIGDDWLQRSSSESNTSITVEVLIEISLMFSDPTPGRIRPIDNSCTAYRIDIPVYLSLAIPGIVIFNR